MEEHNAIEMTYNGETKTVALAYDASKGEDHWDSLEKLFREQFKIQQDAGSIKARYIDAEGDVVTLDTTEELNELLALGTPDKPLLLTFSLFNASVDKKHHRAECKRTRKTKEEKFMLRQAKKQERLARREERLKKKEERRACRVHKHASKEEWTEKKEAREEQIKKRLEERRARKALRDSGKIEEDNDPIELPQNVSRLFLDGNNMMFVTPLLRSLTLNRGGGGGRGGRGRAEALLAAVAESFVSSMMGADDKNRLTDTVLIFDNTHTDITTTLAGGTTFRICSARPHTPTSDEVLIAWAKEASQKVNEQDGKAESSRMLFVTSDRALRDQLKDAGGSLMKPKNFLRLAYQLAHPQQDKGVNNVSDTDLDDWLGSLLA